MPERSQTILVVDDEPEIRKLVTAMLTRSGYRVLSADSGENAVRVFKANPEIELVLTDVVSPGMSGPMIVDEIVSLRPNIKILFMSGYDSTHVVQRYVMKAGFSLLPKPFTMEQLQRKVQAALAGGERTMGA